jgi:hypothetical protein
VFVALVIQHGKRLRHIVFCGTPDSIVFFDIILQGARLSKKKVFQHKMCLLIFYTRFV